jgi:hypothetical protein
MRSFRFIVVKVAASGALMSLLALTAVTASMGGCADNGGLCPRPVGNFTGTYTPVSGNCTNIKSRDLAFSEDPQLSMRTTINTLSDSVTTEVNLIGCTIAVEQSISNGKEKRMVAHLEGNLAVDDARELSGRLSYQEFLEDGMTASCFSEVEVNFVQQGAVSGAALDSTVTIGAAAEAALASP